MPSTSIAAEPFIGSTTEEIPPQHLHAGTRGLGFSSPLNGSQSPLFTLLRLLHCLCELGGGAIFLTQDLERLADEGVRLVELFLLQETSNLLLNRRHELPASRLP